MLEPNVHNDESLDDKPSSTWAVSLCFWFALTIAAIVYSGVALAPKFSVWDNVRQEYLKNSEQLGALGSDVDYLERVESALETDPEFVERLSNVSTVGESKQSDGESVPVSGNLLFGQDIEAATHIETQPPVPRYSQLVQQLAGNRSLRAGLLSFAACLTIFAFAFLNDAGTELVQTAGNAIRATLRLPASRYFAAASLQAETDTQPTRKEAPQSNQP